MRLLRALNLLLGLTAIGLGSWLLSTLWPEIIMTNLMFVALAGMMIGSGMWIVIYASVIREDEGLRVYKTKLCEYLKRAGETETDRIWLMIRSAELEAIEMALGLSKERIRKIQEKVRASLDEK